MADVQPENGYTRIATELLEALAKQPLPSNAFQVLIVIIRKTYGYNKSTDAISLSQLSKATGMSKSACQRAIKGLKMAGMVLCLEAPVHSSESTPTSIYCVQKDYDKWTQYPSQSTIYSKQSMGGTLIKQKRGPLTRGIQKIDITKDTITKDISRKRITKDEPEDDMPDHKDLVEYFVEKWKENRGGGISKYVFKKGKDGVHVKSMLAEFGLEKSKRIVDRFFEDTDPWLKDTEYSLGVLWSRINKYAQEKPRAKQVGGFLND